MKLHQAIAAAMASASTAAYHGRAPREQSTYPYTVWVVDTSPVPDTAGAACWFALTCDTFARDSATKSGAELADEAVAALDAVFQRGHLVASDLSGSSSLITRTERGQIVDPEDEGMTRWRTVYNGQWIDRE
ncbi:MAG: hypothetical protein ABFC80_04090 [Coriobacteriales bacterium]